jgi:hypothetical protein
MSQTRLPDPARHAITSIALPLAGGARIESRYNAVIQFSAIFFISFCEKHHEFE